jgi:hypothetical protein
LREICTMGSERGDEYKKPAPSVRALARKSQITARLRNGLPL